MNEQVTYKALFTTALGVLIAVFVWTSNAKSKLDQIDENKKQIEKVNNVVLSIKADIYNNNIEVIKAISEIKLLIKDKQDRQ